MLPVSDEMRRALSAASPVWDFGVDLLDDQDRPVEDISADVLSLSMQRDLHADVHGQIDLELTRDLRWGVDRVRPWVAVARTKDGPWHRWNLGVYLLTTPDVVAGGTPRSRAVEGNDKLWLLHRAVGDTYVVEAGTSYLDAIRDVLAAAGVTGRLLLQGDRQGTVLDEPAVWPLAEYSWLDVINGLLGMIAYQGLWVDEQGHFRSAPTVDPAVRPSVWTFDTTDTLKGIVGNDRTLSADVFDLPNWWRFVRKMDRQPTEGDGIYTVDRTAGAPYVRRKVVQVDAADQAALVSEGNRIVAEDTANERLISFDTTPLPFEHGDVVTVRDPDLGVSARALVRRWSLTGTGSSSVELEVL